MDLWGVVAILGGITVSIVAISIIAKYTGIGEFLGNFLSIVSTFFQSVFSGLQSMIQAAPSAIKLIFFSIIFLLLGGILYNSTVGITHACVDKTVYHMDFMTGMSSLMMPKDFTPLYEEFSDLPESVSVGFIITDSDGNPTIIVPDKYSPGVEVKLTGTSGTGGIGEANAFYEMRLVYGICRTSNDACYLIDSSWNNPWCTVKDNGGGVVVSGSLIYKITIAYDEKRTPSIYYTVNSLSMYSILHLSSFKLNKCSVSGDEDFPWLRTTGSKVVEINNISGTVFNARDIKVILQVFNSSSVLGGSKERKEVVISPNDPEYLAVQAKASSFNNFVKKNGGPMTFTSKDVITFSCADSKTNSETLLVFGIPILSTEFIFAIIFLVVVLGIIKFVKGK